MAISGAEVMRVLGNQRRLQILALLADPVAHFPPQTDGDLLEDGVCLLFIADKLGISQPSASRHMYLLSSIGCATPKPMGRWTFYRRNEAGIADALDVIQQALAATADMTDG